MDVGMTGRGSSDPYVAIEVGNDVVETTTVQPETLNPVWCESFIIKISKAGLTNNNTSQQAKMATKYRGSPANAMINASPEAKDLLEELWFNIQAVTKRPPAAQERAEVCGEFKRLVGECDRLGATGTDVDTSKRWIAKWEGETPDGALDSSAKTDSMEAVPAKAISHGHSTPQMVDRAWTRDSATAPELA
jgi:hypothetical protein